MDVRHEYLRGPEAFPRSRAIPFYPPVEKGGRKEMGDSSEKLVSSYGAFLERIPELPIVSQPSDCRFPETEIVFPPSMTAEGQLILIEVEGFSWIQFKCKADGLLNVGFLKEGIIAGCSKRPKDILVSWPSSYDSLEKYRQSKERTHLSQRKPSIPDVRYL
jgi:hypothetical protein